ncbi:MAG TPA: TIM barrel protein [Streptosporangiaceae bacterium]|jgi:sugar phosphate isomerase/epimerase|nr:TIM barrel protein [Streptosporangiaceae bacterium]
MPLPSVSVQLYSVRDVLEADPAGTIERLAGLGYRQVEAGFKYLTRLPELAPAIRAHGLVTPVMTGSLFEADRGPVFDLARSLGAGTVVDTFIPAPRWQTQADVDHIAAELNAAAAEAAALGLRVGYHNHWWELEQRFGGGPALDALIVRLDPAVVLEVDAYWVAVGGEEPVAFVRRHAGRVRFLHLKDGPVSRDNHAQLPAGQGALPIPAVLAAATGLEAGVVEFDDYAGDVFDAVAQSLRYLDGLAARA